MTTGTDIHFELEQEEGYAITFHSLSRNKSLSLEAIALLVYLLSHNQDKYHIKMKTVINHFQGRCGKDKIYRLVNELISEGYIHRKEVKQKNKFSGWLYKVASKPKFKKCLPRPGFPDAGIPDPENEHAKEYQDISIDKSIDTKEDQCKERSPQAPTSAEADSLCTLLFEKIKEHLPGFKSPNMKNWRVEMDRMLRIDKRAFEQAKQVIEWLQEDKWFKANILSPKSLRNNFDRIIAKMQMVNSEGIVRRNRDFALKMREKYPDKMKALTFDAKFVSNKFNAKDLPWNLPEETFRRELASLFNASGSQG